MYKISELSHNLDIIVLKYIYLKIQKKQEYGYTNLLFWLKLAIRSGKGNNQSEAKGTLPR